MKAEKARSDFKRSNRWLREARERYICGYFYDLLERPDLLTLEEKNELIDWLGVKLVVRGLYAWPANWRPDTYSVSKTGLRFRSHKQARWGIGNFLHREWKRRGHSCGTNWSWHNFCRQFGWIPSEAHMRPPEQILTALSA